MIRKEGLPGGTLWHDHKWSLFSLCIDGIACWSLIWYVNPISIETSRQVISADTASHGLCNIHIQLCILAILQRTMSESTTSIATIIKNWVTECLTAPLGADCCHLGILLFLIIDLPSKRIPITNVPSNLFKPVCFFYSHIGLIKTWWLCFYKYYHSSTCNRCSKAGG